MPKTLKFALLLAVAASFPVSAETVPTIQLSKVLLDTQSKPATIHLKGGTMCVFPSDIKLDEQKKTEDYERYDNLFSERLKLMGYRVTTTSQDLFAAADGSKDADYLVGATLRPEDSNLCSSVAGWKGQIKLSVEWQIYKRAERKVVDTVATSGLGERIKFDRSGYAGMWNDAFGQSLDALIAQGTLKKYLGEPDAKLAADLQAAKAAKAAAENAAFAAAEAAKAAKRH